MEGLSALGSRLERHIEDEAATWSLPPGAARAAFVLPIAGGLALLAARATWRESYAWLLREDSLVEVLSAAFWLTAVLPALIVSIRLLTSRRVLLAALWLALGIVCLLAAGEEVSWGQRIIGFDTPDGLREANEQGEVTVHNLHSVGSIVRVGMLCAGLYGSVIAYAVRSRFRDGPWVDYLFPPMFLSTPFFLMAAYRIAWAALLAPEALRDTPVSFGEWLEMCVPAAIATFALLHVRRAVTTWTGISARLPRATA
jgi:hypothetical protein